MRDYVFIADFLVGETVDPVCIRRSKVSKNEGEVINQKNTREKKQEHTRNLGEKKVLLIGKFNICKFCTNLQN